MRHNYPIFTTALKYFKKLIFIISFLICIQLNAQNINELSTILDSINQIIESEVKLSKSIYQQAISYEAETPNRIVLKVSETGTKKNRTTNYEYAVNLGFIKRNMVRIASSKTQMAVTAKSSNSGIVKVIENGEADGFENELKIRCSDIDMARAVESLLKKAIPIAEQLWKGQVQLPEDKAGQLSFLSKRVVDFSKEDEGVRQSIATQEDGRLFILSQEYDGGEDEEQMSYLFDLEDINPSSIKANAKNDAFTISLKTTSQNNYIEEMEEEEKSFVNSITLYTDDYEQAQTIIIVLKSLVEQARKEARARKKSVTQISEPNINQFISSFDFNEEKITQTYEGDCSPVFTKTVSEEDETTEMKYIFDLADINADDVELNASRKGAFVELQTKDRKRWIAVYEDNEQESYSSKCSIGVPDIPSGKELIKHITAYAKSCPIETPPEDLTWIETKLSAVGELADFPQQTIEFIDDNACKMRLTSLKELRNGAKETVTEFNLFDVDPKQIKFDAKGKKIILTLSSLKREKIFSEVTNSDKVAYSNEVEIELADILIAKKMAATFTNLVNTCE